MAITPSLIGAGHRVAVHRPGPSPTRVLARLDAARLARHPVFVGATTLGILFTVMALSEQSDQVTGDSLGLPVVALTVGLGAMIAAYQLTRSFGRADELLASSPTPLVSRTGALCLMAAVPALISSGWLIVKYVVRPAALDTPEWMYGTFSHLDVAWVLVGNSVAAAAGGTLLGIAAGCWWRFRGASVLLVVGVAAWTLGIGAALSTGGAMPAWQRSVRLFAPVTFFNTTSQNSDSVDSLNGSPGWHLLWLVTLCALAALAALLWRAEGHARRNLVRLGAITLVVSASAYVLAATGGVAQTVRSYPDGHSVVLRLTP